MDLNVCVQIGRGYVPGLTSMEPAASGGSFTGIAQGCFLCGKMLIAEWELSETGQV